MFKKKKSPHLRLGNRGEKTARKLCRQLGLEILCSNFTYDKKGEIDIIARDGAVICFIEVKTRRHEKISRAAEFVTSKKKTRLRRTAYHYLKMLPGNNLRHRFDIIEVVGKSPFFTCRYWPDSWRVE